MFNIEQLNRIRAFELSRVMQMLPSGASILEIGGGTGHQARRLAEQGFKVASIDVPTSCYATDLEFPVRSYDGRKIPFPSNSFDVVFSSNVLEHVKDTKCLHAEITRVLKEDGFCIHVVPTTSWRLATNIAHYTEMLQRCCMELRLLPTRPWRDTLHQSYGIIYHYSIVPRHGEKGNAFTELHYFSRTSWTRHFQSHSFRIEQFQPIGIWYSGHMVLGSRLSLSARAKLARFWGNACYLFVVRPCFSSSY